MGQGLTAIKAEGGIEDWVYQGANKFPGDNPMTGFRMNVTEYQTRDGLSLVSKKKGRG